MKGEFTHIKTLWRSRVNDLIDQRHIGFWKKKEYNVDTKDEFTKRKSIKVRNNPMFDRQ